MSDFDEVIFQGSLQSLKARFVNVIINKCIGKLTCKSDAEIERFLDDHRVWIGYNDKQIEIGQYGENSISSGQVFEFYSASLTDP